MVGTAYVASGSNSVSFTSCLQPNCVFLLASMSPSARFKRALVTLLLELARVYGLTLKVNRDSQDDTVKDVWGRDRPKYAPRGL